jgi:hypothetical protein
VSNLPWESLNFVPSSQRRANFRGIICNKIEKLLPELQGIRDRTDFFEVFALVQIIHVEAMAFLVAEPPRERFSNRLCRKRRRVKLFQLENRSRTVAKLSNFRPPDADSGSSIDPFAFPPAHDEALHFFDGIARLECSRSNGSRSLASF